MAVPRGTRRRAQLSVPVQTRGHEFTKAFAGRLVAARHRIDTRHAAREPQPPQSSGHVAAPQVERRCDGGRGDIGERRHRFGAMCPCRSEELVDPRAQVGGSTRRRAEERQRHDAVAVHREHRGIRRTNQPGALSGYGKRRIVVAHHEHRAARKLRHQLSVERLFALDVGPVVDAERRRARPVVGHALQDEGVQALAGPGIAKPQPFVDDERLAELGRAARRVVERVAALEPAAHLHPVKDVVGRAPQRHVV